MKKQSTWKGSREDEMDRIHKSKHRPEKQKYKHNKFWMEEDEIDLDLGSIHHRGMNEEE